jgi:hypothetical protein
MSRKHYRIIADAIGTIADGDARCVAAVAMADCLGRLYARFDRARFLSACGVTE